MADKVIVIAGPTASGKSALAVKLAKKFNGEIISADSRQIYRGLDIGTGKITEREMLSVPHHMLDVTDPRRRYSVAQFQRKATVALQNIERKEKVPIVCGGTGFYIQALVDGINLPNIAPNNELRRKLEKKSVSQLFKILKKLDPRRAKTIDKQNPRRLIRAIEITRALGKVPELKKTKKYDVLFIGLNLPDGKLKHQIQTRLLERIRRGLISEAKRLHSRGLSYQRMEELGLEYRSLAKFLRKRITREKMIEELQKEIWGYAKRQRTWFKREKRISWFELPNKNETKRLLETVHSFLNN